MLHAILELIAAFSGFYFLRHHKNSKLRPFVYFLVITVCVDAIGLYTLFIDRFEFLKGLKTTVFAKNFWLFNIFLIGSIIFYILFYRSLLLVKRHQNILKLLLIVSIGVIIFNVFNGGAAFFDNYLKYNFIWNTFSVFICVVLYFYEILLSDKILVFYKSALFYISIGLLFWWLILPPLIFYMPYYKQIYPNLVNIRDTMFILANIYLYSCYTIGFLWGKEQ